MEENIINRVTSSDMITLNLEDYLPTEECVIYDLKQNLYEELILKEKDFRTFIKRFDWSAYKNKNVAITCSADAIIPAWAYMLIASHLQPYAHFIMVGSLEEIEKILIKEALSSLNLNSFTDAKVVIKGCGDKPISNFAFAEVTRLLHPYVSSLMYGEPCSTVPIYKRKKE